MFESRKRFVGLAQKYFPFDSHKKFEYPKSFYELKKLNKFFLNILAVRHVLRLEMNFRSLDQQVFPVATVCNLAKQISAFRQDLNF